MSLLSLTAFGLPWWVQLPWYGLGFLVLALANARYEYVDEQWTAAEAAIKAASARVDAQLARASVQAACAYEAAYADQLRRQQSAAAPVDDADAVPAPVAPEWTQAQLWAWAGSRCEHVDGCTEPRVPGCPYGLCVGHGRPIWAQPPAVA